MLFFLKLAAHQLWEQPKRFSAVGYEIALGWWVGSCWVREGISLGKQDVPSAYLCDWHWSCCAQPTLPRMGNPFLCLFPSAVKTRAARTKPLPTTRAGEKKKSTRKSSCWEFIVLSLTSFSIVCQMPDVKWVMHVSNTRHSHHVSTSWLFWKSSEQGTEKWHPEMNSLLKVEEVWRTIYTVFAMGAYSVSLVVPSLLWVFCLIFSNVLFYFIYLFLFNFLFSNCQ